MDNYQKRFFRFIMSARFCQKDPAIAVLKKIKNDQNILEQDLTNFVADINSNLKCFDLEIMEGKSEISGLKYVCLAQTSNYNVSLPTKFIDKKCSTVFGIILSMVALSKNNAITETHAVNAGGRADMTRGAVQAALAVFVEDLWLESNNGWIYFGVRTVLELGQLLVTQYPQLLHLCTLCRRNVFYGATCHQCQKKTHRPCLEKMFGRNQLQTCPGCHTALSDASLSNLSTDDEDESMPTPPKKSRLN